MNIVVDPPQRHTGLNMHSNQPGARESDEKKGCDTSPQLLAQEL